MGFYTLITLNFSKENEEKTEKKEKKESLLVRGRGIVSRFFVKSFLPKFGFRFLIYEKLEFPYETFKKFFQKPVGLDLYTI